MLEILMLLIGLALSVAAPDSQAGRRLAWGKLRKGLGHRTEVFGGGDSNASVRERCTFASKSSMRDWRLHSTFDPFNSRLADQSSGQSTWMAEQIFAQTWHRNARGTFVEFGARDGLVESNTKLFEVTFGWDGLLVEAGRDYVAALREQRQCCLNGRPGACVWTALDAAAGMTKYWVPFDKTLDRKALKEQYLKREQWMTENATVDDRSVSTATLDSLLSLFQVKHIDLLVADCEGCEPNALKGLNLSAVTVDVFMVENPPCELYETFQCLDYVGLPFSKPNDMVWVHRVRIAARMSKPPSLMLPTNGHHIASRSSSLERKALLAQKCPLVRTHNIWDESLPWPPGQGTVRGCKG